MINDGKTCEGCVLFYPGSTDQLCSVKGGHGPVVKQYPACDRFTPNLEYRRTVALERIADSLDDGPVRSIFMKVKE